MLLVALLVAVVSTLFSIVSLSYLAYRYHDKRNPLTMSQLMSRDKKRVRQFQIVLWIGGLGFLTAMIFASSDFSAPILVSVVALVAVVSEILLGFFPARGRQERLHEIIAYVMAVAMLALSVLFYFEMEWPYAFVQIVIVLGMIISGGIANILRKNFLIYELFYIFLSHASVVFYILDKVTNHI